MINNNKNGGAKNRRLFGGIAAVALITAAYYLNIDPSMFKVYVIAVGVLYAIAALNWTATDIVGIIKGAKNSEDVSE